MVTWFIIDKLTSSNRDNVIFLPFLEYYHYNDFLDAVDAYETDLEDNRIKAASDIVKKVKIYSS